jgi:hypothetical protein
MCSFGHATYPPAGGVEILPQARGGGDAARGAEGHRWPEDELALFAALKGSLFAIPDSTLLPFRHEIGNLHPFGS